MATSRQPQAFNNFIRAVKSCRPNTYQNIRTPPSTTSKLHTTSRKAQSTYPNRYGPAATEGLPPPPKPANSLTPRKDDSKQVERKDSSLSQTLQNPQTQAEPKQSDKQERSETSNIKAEVEHDAVPTTDGSPLAQASEVEHPEQAISQKLPPDLNPNEPLGNKELDIVLSVPAPSDLEAHRSKHPHLEPSPYEHHFDTYSLVQELAKEPNAFSEKQAITVMKAVRQMLSINLDIAKESLISKSDIENESYLFRAACSELRTTLQTTRASENQRQRTQRASLQHELDILNQKVTQDMQNMREELKGLFNDRRMGLQEEKRKIDSKISELNYEITVLLNSEAKSEVEGLRWVLTRRAALAIGTAAFMTLSALQYYSVKNRENAEIEKRRKAAEKAEEARMAIESQQRYTTPSRSSGTQTEYEESLG